MGKKEVGTPSCLHNVVASGTKITGDIAAGEDLRIDGTVKGNITCKGKIIIGPSSIVLGDIEGTNIDLTGQITGNVICSENIILRSTAQLTGDLKTKSIEIEPGAAFFGNCSMIETQEQN